MNRKYRKTIIAGNWKMNLLPSEVKGYGEKLKCLAPKVKWCEIVICPPSLMLQAALKTFSNARIHVGAQNICTEAKGAYTEDQCCPGQGSGCQICHRGHSERRQYYGETDKQVNLKVNIVMKMA